ncbi:MAG: FecR domain-containing protein [Reichenbachiella sp.]
MDTDILKRYIIDRMEDYNWQQIAKQLKGKLPESEQIEWREWLNESETNQALFEQCQKVWSEQRALSELTDEAFLKHIQSDPDQVWEEILAKTSAQSTAVKSTNYSWVYKMAAAVLLMVGAGWIAIQFGSDLSGNKTVVQTGDFTDSIFLPDSTQVWLNKDSQISYGDFQGDNREVELDGEAFFEVRRNVLKPFIVETNHARIEVLGTSFNINSRNSIEDESLTVASGKVAYSPLGNSELKIELMKNEFASLDPNGGLPVKGKVDRNYMAWKTGLLIFKNDQLVEVARVLNRYYDVQINLSDAEIGLKRMTATFQHMTADDAIHVICNLYDLNSSTKGSTITLTQNN